MAKRRSSLTPTISARLTKPDEATFIELARKRFKQSTDADEKQRTRELEDLEFYDDKQWPEEIVLARQGVPGNPVGGLPPVPPRPTLTIGKVREPVRQVLNQERAADLGVEIAAADDFGEATAGISPEEIELREGLVRRIQRESQASDARSWAFQRAVIAGRGYYRVMTRYVPGKTFDQEIYVDRIYNQGSVSLDPSHEQPDGSDAEWGFIGTDLPWDRYLAEYGKVGDDPNLLTQASDSEWRALGDELPGWFTADGETRSVRIVEYWYIERVPRTIVQLENGTAVYEDEHDSTVPLGVDDQGDPIIREVMDTHIKWAKLDGVQVLEETDWDGKYLPIIKVLGEEIVPYDSERRAVGMVRPARGAQQGFNATASSMVERMNLNPLSPWMGAAGFDEGFEKEYELSATRVMPALHYNTTDVNGQPIPPPTRTAVQLDSEAFSLVLQFFDAAIKSTTAMPDPSLGNVDPSIKSAKGIRQLLDQAQKGTSHFMDNLSRSIRYEGLIVNDLLASVYQRPGRLARMMTPHGDTQAVPLQTPFVPHPTTGQPMTTTQGPMGPMPVQSTMEGAKTYTLTPGATFNVTVKVTKSYDTRREEQESTISDLIQTEPQLMGVFGDLLFKYNDGPGHEELEERAKVMLVPPVQALLSGQAQPNPQIQQLQQQVQQLTQLLQTKTAEIQAKGSIDMQRDQADNATKLQVAQINQEGAFAVASLKAQLEAINTALAALQAERTAFHEAVQTMAQDQSEQRQIIHEAAQGAAERAHEVAVQALGHQQQLAQGAQQAALAPAPVAEGNGAGNV